LLGAPCPNFRTWEACTDKKAPKLAGRQNNHSLCLRWLKARERELLPTRYVHAVFTLPRGLAPLALQNKQLIYNLLFHASAETLLEIARDPRHLGAEIVSEASKIPLTRKQGTFLSPEIGEALLVHSRWRASGPFRTMLRERIRPRTNRGHDVDHHDDQRRQAVRLLDPVLSGFGRGFLLRESWSNEHSHSIRL
jgi:hypothetical protein